MIIWVHLVAFLVGVSALKNDRKTSRKSSAESVRNDNSSPSDYDRPLVVKVRPVVEKATVSQKKRYSTKSVNNEVPFHVLGPIQDYDTKFVRDWWQLMRQLWTADGHKNGIRDEMPVNAVEFLPRESEKIIHAPSLTVKWTPVSCNHLGLKLKPIKTLQDNGKNRVIHMKDTNSGKEFVYKTYSSVDAYTREIIFSQFIAPNDPFMIGAVCRRSSKSDDSDIKQPALVFEYVKGKESLDYARTASLADLQRISAQLLAAIEHIHYLGYLHADLKPQNVLIDELGNVKVIDFGFAGPIEAGKRRQGTRMTMAPELHHKVPGRVHEGVDWWAYGSTLAMWYGAYFDEQQFANQNDGAKSGRRGSRNTFVPANWNSDEGEFKFDKVPAAFSRPLRSFLYHFFHIDPDTRQYNTKRLQEALHNHEFFDGVNWRELVIA